MKFVKEWNVETQARYLTGLSKSGVEGVPLCTSLMKYVDSYSDSCSEEVWLFTQTQTIPQLTHHCNEDTRVLCRLSGRSKSSKRS